MSAIPVSSRAIGAPTQKCGPYPSPRWLLFAFHDGLAWQQAVDEAVAMVGRKEQEYIAT